jgi:serine/threonine protein kinase
MSRETDPVLSGMSGRIADYRLDGYIGQGAAAVVYLAQDVRSGQNVALKVLNPELARDDTFRAQFLHEARAAAAVDHPYIIPVYASGEADGTLYLAMRYVQGGDARSLLNRFGPLPFTWAWTIIAQVASALDAAHAHGLIHRDVKPSNMLLDTGPAAVGGLARRADGGDFDHVYLSDFGMSTNVPPDEITATGQFAGTLDYVAPEQIEGRAVDGRADLYALASAGFELLCGTPPFGQDQGLTVMYAQLYAPPPSAVARRPELPAAVDQVLATALAKNPADRYATCGQFADALHAALGFRPGEQEPAGNAAGTAVLDNGTVVPGNGTAVLDTGIPVPGNGTPVLDNRTPVLDDGTPVPDNRTPVLDNGTPVLDDGTPVLDDGTPVPDNRTAVLDTGTAALDAEPAGSAPGPAGLTGGYDVGPATYDLASAGYDAAGLAGYGAAETAGHDAGTRDASPGPVPAPAPALSGPGWPSAAGPPASEAGPVGADPMDWPESLFRPPPAQPPLSRRPGRRLILAVAAGTIVVVLIIVGVFLLQGSSSPGHPAGASSPGPSPSAPAATVASRQAAAVNVLLGSSATARKNLVGAVADVHSCARVAAAVGQIQQVVNQRSTEDRRASGLSMAALANGATVKADLLAALRSSLQADRDYLTWAQQQLARCRPGAPSRAYTAAIGADQQAGTAKETFVRAWNPVAARYGLPAETTSSF